MNRLLRIPYSAAGSLATALGRVVPPGQSKFQRALVARRDIVDRYRSWARDSRDASRPLVWFHAPSVGEGLQALPVIKLVRQLLPAVQLAYTHYSPSAEQFARSVPCDFVDYLPFDTFAQAEAIISALRPHALVFSKLDVWPALTESAAKARVSVGVISATLPASSARQGFFARRVLGDAYRSLERVGAIDEQDAARLVNAGVRENQISITGDTRYDQVWTRAQSAPGALVQSLRSSRPTLVAGSIWPSDELHLFAAWLRVRERIPDARLIIAPHETSPAQLRTVERWANTASLVLARIDSTAARDADVVLVDRYGILGDLYALADVAYVGGGFHSAGVHSVLEPAAFGAPVLFGPKNERSRDAQKLSAARGGAEIRGSTDLALRLADWLGSISGRDVAGANAREMVREGLGAAERSFDLVKALLRRESSA
ncbi:MAG: 3-deoxy-D-manno-octulosonic acid transferase [Gemmatimonadaceae bacterium]